MNGYTVSMTGFNSDPKMKDYLAILETLEIRYMNTLVEKVDALIVNVATTQKYKISKVYKRPIACVTIDWLIDSDKANSILDLNNYLIKDIFYGVEAYLFGFKEKDAEKIQEMFKNNGGICHNIDISRLEYLLKNQTIELLIIDSQLFAKMRGILAQKICTVVGIEWIFDSLRDNICKFPYDYAYNQCDLRTKDTAYHLSKMKGKLQIALQPQFQHSSLLQGTIVFLGAHNNNQVGSVLKKLIVFYGGYFLDNMCSSVTHVLIEPVQETEYLTYCTNGMLTFVLRNEWLLDTIYFGKRMLENDYAIRSFKQKIEQTIHQNQFSIIRSNRQNFGQTFEEGLINTISGKIFPFRNQQESNRKSISMISLPFFNKTPKIQSKIFENKHFYIESSQRNEHQLQNFHRPIIRNSGQCYGSRAQIKEGLCYYVLKDSSKCPSKIKKLKAQVRKNVLIQPVSFRWVEQCIKKAEFLDVLTGESYIYKPFPFSIPIPNFHKLIFTVVGQDDVLRRRLNELYNVLGSIKNLPNKSEVTHCLCISGFQKVSKYRQLRQQNENTLFLRWEWLIECANTGKIVDTKQFFIDS